MSIMGNPLVHDSPKVLNGIEVGRVGRQEVQFHTVLRTIKPWLKHLRKMVTRIVEYDVNCGRVRVVLLNLFQYLPSGFSIDLCALDEGERGGFEIKRTLNVDPLTTQCGLDRRLLTLREPAMGWTALILGMHRVRKQNFLTRNQ